jgi:subtilisin-like proprotein convertase family protein
MLASKLRRMLVVLGLATAVGLVVAGPATAGTFSNTASITINDSTETQCDVVGTATPYPSDIAVSGLTGTVSSVTVTLTGLSHTFPDDVDVLLVGPQGQKVLLMADSGGGSDLDNVNLTFDDAASNSLPDSDQIVTGTYKPTIGTTNGAEGCDHPADFPSPAPAGPYDSALSAFSGTNPNGTWSLYVIDDASADSGSISGGWSLTITTEALAATVSSMRATRAQNGVVVRWRTGTEVGTLGFNVFRQQGNRRVRVNRQLIPAIGSVSGKAYAVLDRRAPRHRAVRYWLQDVSTSGARTWHGPVRVAAA